MIFQISSFCYLFLFFFNLEKKGAFEFMSKESTVFLGLNFEFSDEKIGA